MQTMEMKRILYIFSIFMAAACAGIKDSDPYGESLHLLTVSAQYPEGYEGFDLEGSDALVEDVNTGNRWCRSH